MKKLVYNNFTNQLGLLDKDTNLFREVYTNETRSVNEKDEFRNIENADEIYSMIDDNVVTEVESPKDISIVSLAGSIRTQLVIVVIIVFILLAIFTNVCNKESPGEYQATLSTDTLPATSNDIKFFIEEYEVNHNIRLTDWRKKVIMERALNIKKTRAHFIVDSIADDQRIKYRLK